ncbi:MAG: hypothetical protein J6125_01835, partial [Clostridia bacterium]|nr:hypothetical protein [Clostridia bacterium]
VDGQTMDALGYDAFLDAIRGEAGTTVSLVWLTPADPEPRTADVVRARVDKRTVLLRDLPGEDRVGYLRITGFDGLTYAAFKASLDRLIAEGKEAVVFDLRGNGGGTLDSVCRVLSYLLPDGDIVTVDYAAPDAQDYTIRAEGETYHSGGRSERFPDAAHALTLPVAVLCDAGTASAAELFCAALRDYTAAGAFDAVIVGAPTYGKGTVQTSHLLPDGSAVKLTVATYAPPSGVCYDGVGILPDRPVEADPTAPDLYLRDLSLDPQCAAAVAALCAKID